MNEQPTCCGFDMVPVYGMGLEGHWFCQVCSKMLSPKLFHCANVLTLATFTKGAMVPWEGLIPLHHREPSRN